MFSRPAIGLLILFALLGGTLTAQAATFYSRQNGNWTTASTWSQVACGGAASTTTPGQNDDVIICNSHTVTWNNNRSTTINNLTINSGGILTIGGNRNINLNTLVQNGTVNGTGKGDLRIGRTGGQTLSGTGTFANSNGSSELRILSNVTVLAGTDLIWNNNNVVNLNNFTLTNNGKIEILNPAEFLSGGSGTFLNNNYLVYTKQANFPTNLILDGSPSGNTVEYGATGATTRRMSTTGSYWHILFSGTAPMQSPATTSTTTIRGNITINSGATFDANTGTKNINVAGNWINNGSFIEQTSLVTFNGSTNNQTITLGATETFYDLTINNTNTNGSVTSNGNISITNARTLQLISGIFNMGTNTLTQASGNANLTASGGDLQLAKTGVTLPELTGTYSITGGTITFNGAGAQTIRSLNATPSAYFNITLGGSGTKTLAGNIQVRGNWTNSGATLAGAFTVTFNGSTTQTITNTAGELFNAVTVNTTGLLQFAATTNVTISSTLTMTAGNININGRTLTLGNGSGATLSRTAGICYQGTFQRYFPVGAITSTSGNFYGLFPVGTSTDYRPVEINSTSNPTTAGTVSVLHTDAATSTDVAYNDNEGTTIQRITDMTSAISTATLAGGTYNLTITFTKLSATGNLTDLRLETLAGSPRGVGASGVNTGSVGSPVLPRTGLTLANLTNTFVAATKDKSTTPLVASYYSRRTGNWNDATAGNATWSLTSGGPSCDCVPINSSRVYINPAHTVTVTAAATADFVTVNNTATLTGTSNLTVNFDLNTAGTGRITPTAGVWSINRNLTISGTSTSSTGATTVVLGTLTIDLSNSLTLTNILVVNGNLVLNGTLATGSSTLSMTGASATLSGSGSFTGAAGTVLMTNNKTIVAGTVFTVQPTISLSAATTVNNLGTITTTNNITGANAATSVWTNGANSSLTTTGAILNTGTLDASAAFNTVNYNNLGAQTVKSPLTTYYNLILSQGGTKTAGGNIVVTNLVTIQNAAVFTIGTNSLTGAAGLTMSGTAELSIGTNASNTYPELTGTYSIGTGTTMTFTQSGNANYTLRGVSYYNVNLNGSGAGGANGSNYDFASGAAVLNNLNVAVSGISRLNNSNTLNIGGDLTINSTSTNASVMGADITTSTFTMINGLFNTGTSARTLQLNGAGGWTQSGGTLSGSGNVLFGGAVDQSISGSIQPVFSNLEVSNTASNGVIMNIAASVAGTLTLTEGNFVTTASNILTMNAGSSVSGGDDTSFIDGPMNKIGSTAFTFPVGKSGYYRSIDIAPTAVGTIRAEYFGVDPNGAGYNTASKDVTLDHITKGEYWALNLIAGTPSATVSLSWSSNSGTVDDLPNLRVAGWNGSTWKDFGNGGTTGSVSPGTGTISTASTITSAQFGPFTLASANTNNPLPIGLISFTAAFNGSGVDLNWVTETEKNNDYFTIERTITGESFEEVARVKGAGTTTFAQRYYTVDTRPLGGRVYYRLKQTDYDGTYTYSKLVTVDVPESASWSLYPNPATGNFFQVGFGVEDLGKSVYIKVQDLQGLELETFTAGTLQETILPVSLNQALAPGIYIISIAVDQQVVRKKLVIK